MIAFALVVVALAVVGVARGLEVRTTLLAAALALGARAGDVPAVVRKFFETFADEKFVIPICSAMGFAFVLTETGCDRSLVRVLLAPVRRVRGLLIPGVVLAGVLVNVPVISQASTSVCLGAVVVPLLRAAGFSAGTIGATLLLGASIGGELMNPGAPELGTIRDKVGGSTQDLMPHTARLLMVVVPVALVVHWLITLRAERGRVPTAEATVEPLTAIDFARALVPVVPIALLFVAGPPLDLAPVPGHWLVPGGDPHDPRAGPRLVGLAMMAGVVAAAVTAPRQARACVPAFFAGAGHGFTRIVSVIVTAVCFGEGIKLTGIAKALGDALQANPDWLVPAAAAVPGGFAFVSGSGIASTQSLFESFFRASPAAVADPHGAGADLGAVVAVASAAGRTMSPVAAVVLTCGTLSGAAPGELARRVAVPLITGVSAAVALRMLGAI